MQNVIDCSSMVADLQQWTKILPPGRLHDSISGAISALETGDMTAPIEYALDLLEAFIMEVVQSKPVYNSAVKIPNKAHQRSNSECSVSTRQHLEIVRASNVVALDQKPAEFA
jgi:hypothetical protein